MGTRPSSISKPLPGREFPERQRMNGSVDDWLNLKKRTDQKQLGFDSNLWCIGSKCYDLSNFLNQHPGGRSWLEMTQGMDCTALFETSHLNIKYAESMLSKYYICDIKNKCDNLHSFDWNRDTCHYHKLRSKVYQKLIQNNKNDKNLRKWNLSDYKMHILSFAALTIWLFSFYYFVSNPSIYSALIAGICLHPLVGVGHNFLHQADNKGMFGMETYWRYIINFTLYDLYEFRVHHALSHHSFINLDSDLEVAAFEPVNNFMANAPTNSFFVYLYAPILFFFIPFMLFLTRVIVNIVNVKFVWNHFLPLIEFLVLILFNFGDENYSFLWLFWLFYIMHGIVSLVVVIVAFPIHRSDYCWTEGEENGTKDFVKHVLLSTVDYYVDTGIVFGLFGFEMFNDHRIHHLFPTLDASKIEQIRPLFVEYCKKNEMKKEFRQDGFGLGELFVGMLRNWYRIYDL